MTTGKPDQEEKGTRDELREAAKNALIKTGAVVVGAATIAFIVDWFGTFSASASLLATVLNHHACSTNGGFVVLALGVSCVGLLLATHPSVERPSRYLIRAISDLMGHIVLAGVGFAFALWRPTFDLEMVWLGFLWLLSGWFCLLIGTLFERRIELEKPGTRKAVAAPWLLVGVILVGFGVLSALPLAVKVKPPQSCEQSRH